MSLNEILLSSGGVLLVLLTLVEITPLKINPWSWFAARLGAAFNKPALDMINKLDGRVEDLEKSLHDTDERFIKYTAYAAQKGAEDARDHILRFNNELLRNIRHTREEYYEVLRKIDAYEKYCREHTEFENNRAVHAIANISRSYDERLVKRDFLPEVGP